MAIYVAFLEFAHILWQASKPTIFLTENKSLTRFFRTKAIQPTLWIACDYVLQFSFKSVQILGSVNTKADFLSWLELKVTDKIRLRIREDVQTTPTEVTTSSSDVADEEHFFSIQVDEEDESEEQTFERIKQIRKKTTERVTQEEPSSRKPSIKEF